MWFTLDQTWITWTQESLKPHHHLTQSKWMTSSLPTVLSKGTGITLTPTEGERSHRRRNQKRTNTEAEVQSMVTVPILQDTSSVPLMTTPVIDITDPQSDSTTVPASMPTTTATVTETTTTTTVLPPPPQPQQDVSTSILIQTIGQLEQNIADLVDANQALEERLDKQGNRIHQLETQDLSRLIREQTVEFIDSQEIDQKIEESVKEVVTASVQHAMRAPLRARFKDLPTSDMKEILLQRMLEENYDKGHEDHKMAYEALQKSIIRDESEKFDADKAEERTKKKSKQDSPKTPPGSPPPPPPPSGASGASGTTEASNSAQDPPPPPPSSATNRGGQSQSFAAPTYLCMNSLDFEAHDMGSDMMDLRQQTHSQSPAYEVVKAFHPHVIHLQFQMEECHKLLTNKVDEGLLRYNVSRPLPLGGPPGQVMIQTEFFFNKDLEYLRFGHKGDRLALSITKMKAASYPDARLEQMWFKRQQFYIERHSVDTNRRAIVRTHIRILSVVKIEVLSLYGYDYMKKIVLRRADNQEYTIAESDFKDLYPSDFEDLYLLNLQGYLKQKPTYRPKTRRLSLLTDVNLYDNEFGYQKPGHKTSILLGQREYQDTAEPRQPRREATAFSDGTLTDKLIEALDYRFTEIKEEAKAQANLPELGKLCWWTHTRRRLQTSLEN
ncbi:hypothetical protein Tco_0543175 [Tanacetum coccineum]